MRRVILFLVIMLGAIRVCLGEALGVAQYEIIHIPGKEELHIKAEFDVEGNTEIIIPAALKSSDTASVDKIVLSIDESRITRKGLKLYFYSSKKEHISISYTVKNSSIFLTSPLDLPYIEEEGFYFNSNFLIQPNAKVNSATELLLKAQIKFHTANNNPIFSSNGKIMPDSYIPLTLNVDKITKKYCIKNVFYLSGSNKILKTTKVNINNTFPMEILLFKVPDQLTATLISNATKVYSIEHNLFGSPYAVNKDLFTAFIYYEPLNSSEEPGFGKNVNGFMIYGVGNSTSELPIIAHEYIHGWINDDIVDTSPSNTYLYTWFTEGFTEYYALKTSLISNLMTKQQILDRYNIYMGITKVAPLKHESYETLAKTQYEFTIFNYKGFLLASELDQHIIKASHGKYSLDDIMRSLIKKFQSGTKFSTLLLKSEIKNLIGDRAEDIFKAIEYGEEYPPTSIPFDIKSKIHYVPSYIPKYGFNLASSVLTQAVTNVDKSSPAYKAGLRDGDFFPRDRNQMGAEPAPGPQTVTLTVGTGSGEKTITYTTESEKITVPQYELLE